MESRRWVLAAAILSVAGCGPNTTEQTKSLLQQASVFPARELRAELIARSRGEKALLKAELSRMDSATLMDALIFQEKSIYGTDDRQDWYSVPAELRPQMDSVAAMVQESQLTPAGGMYALKSVSLGEQFGLCTGEKFAGQPVAARCTGFLAAPDIVVTAGHCIPSEEALPPLRFLFGYRMETAAGAVVQFPASDVYKPVRLMGRHEDPHGADWAVVRLDRSVSGRQPLSLMRQGKLSDTARLYIIGHPSGLPIKRAAGAEVRDNAPASYFVANLDAFGGNSGSPVFEAGAGQVVGVLVRGAPDYIMIGDLSCRRVKVCPDNGTADGCSGESSTRTTEFASLLP